MVPEEMPHRRTPSLGGDGQRHDALDGVTGLPLVATLPGGSDPAPPMPAKPR